MEQQTTNEANNILTPARPRYRVDGDTSLLKPKEYLRRHIIFFRDLHAYVCVLVCVCMCPWRVMNINLECVASMYKLVSFSCMQSKLQTGPYHGHSAEVHLDAPLRAEDGFVKIFLQTYVSPLYLYFPPFLFCSFLGTPSPLTCFPKTSPSF
jgi:hypothetical protein